MRVTNVRLTHMCGRCSVMLVIEHDKGSSVFSAVAGTFKQAYRFAWSQARYTYRIRNGGWRYTS